ncbi:MAG TPA: hypothetical protein VFQ91_14475 [Bryobacteraceae bacterium]|nr:hypothetical protein [Bryobacteraceae bacterium]
MTVPVFLAAAEAYRGRAASYDLYENSMAGAREMHSPTPPYQRAEAGLYTDCWRERRYAAADSLLPGVARKPGPALSHTVTSHVD